MVLLRRAAAGIVIATALAIVGLSVYLAWSAYQWGSLAPQTSRSPDMGTTLEAYARRVNDMETFVIVLLGITGLYTIALIVASEYAAARASRKLERALANARHEIAASLADVRRIQEETRRAGQAALGKAHLCESERQAHPTLQPPHDFQNLNELGWRALQSEPPDYYFAKSHFDASLQAHPNQQRARYGLALVAKAGGDLITAQATLEGALAFHNWETEPNASGIAHMHYALACILGARGLQEPEAQRQVSYVNAMQHLQAAFVFSAADIEQMFFRDIEEGGELSEIANTDPHAGAINNLLATIRVGAS